MLARCFIGALLLGLAVAVLAAFGSGSTNDPFAAMSLFGAYLMVLAGIVGGLLLALALSADPRRKDDRTQGGRPR